MIDSPNRYEISEDSQKIVQINILDVIFDNKICNLIYIHDITKFFKKENINAAAIALDNPEHDETSFVHFTKLQPSSHDIDRELEKTDLLNYP